MNRKRFFGLVLVLVIAALAAPTASQAKTFCTTSPCPRFQINKTEGKIKEGKKVRIISWATLELNTAKIGLITCKNMFAGFATNPGVAGSGGAGEGGIEGYAAYGCSSTLCEGVGQKVEVTPLGETENLIKTEKIVVERITTPWEVHAIRASEAIGGKFHIGGTEPFGLDIGNEVSKSPKQIRFNVRCFGKALNAEFTGELTPEGKNASAIGSGPAEEKLWGGESGELNSVEGGKGSVSGEHIKIFGYDEGEEIAVKEI